MEPAAFPPPQGSDEDRQRIKRLEDKVNQLLQENQLRQQQEQQPQVPQVSQVSQPEKPASDLDSTIKQRDFQEDRKDSEVDLLKEELDKKARECETLQQAKDMLAAEFKTMTEDKNAVQQALIEVDKAKRDLEEQLKARSNEKEALESRVVAATEAARNLQTARAELEAALEKSRLETRDLRCRTAIAEDQANKAEDRARKAETDCQHYQSKSEHCGQELRQLQRKFEEQKSLLCDLEIQMKKEQVLFMAEPGDSPGERLKVMKASSDSALKENAVLKKDLMKARCDMDLCMQKIRDQRIEIQQLRSRQ